MRVRALIVFLLCFSSVCSAMPLTYFFTGTITHASLDRFYAQTSPDERDKWDILDWWPKVGDKYRGTVTYDLESVYTPSPEKHCVNGPLCGGLVSLDMSLGGESISYSPGTDHFVDWHSVYEPDFTAWFWSVRRFDSFNFSHGSFQGIESSFFDPIQGRVDRWLRVPEPTYLGFLGIPFFVAVAFKRYRNKQRARL